MGDLRMPDLNNVLLAGRLTRDPELKYLQSGTALCKLGLAVSRKFKTRDGERREEVLFINVSVWDKLAEFIGETLKKGKPVIVEGRLQSDEWEDKETGQKRSAIEVRAQRVHLLEWDDRGAPPSDSQRSSYSSSRQEEPAADDDIPF